MCERERRKEALNSRPVVAAFCSMLLFLVLIFNEQCAHVHCRFQFEMSMHDICDSYTHHIAIESRLFTLSLSFGLPFSGYIFVELGNLWLYDQYFSSFIACGFDYSFMYCGL